MKTKVTQLLENPKVKFFRHPNAPHGVCIEVTRDANGVATHLTTHYQKTSSAPERISDRCVYIKSNDGKWEDYTEQRAKDLKPKEVVKTPEQLAKEAKELEDKLKAEKQKELDEIAIKNKLEEENKKKIEALKAQTTVVTTTPSTPVVQEVKK